MASAPDSRPTQVRHHLRNRNDLAASLAAVLFLDSCGFATLASRRTTVSADVGVSTWRRPSDASLSLVDFMDFPSTSTRPYLIRHSLRGIRSPKRSTSACRPSAQASPPACDNPAPVALRLDSCANAQDASEAAIAVTIHRLTIELVLALRHPILFGMSGWACEIRIDVPLLQPPVDPASRDGSGMGTALKIWRPKGNPPDCRMQPCNLANCPVT